jgi:transposase
MAIRKKAGEKLDEATLTRVSTLLNQDNPITKKEACEMLNISYNTSRLTKILDDFNETASYREVRKSQNRGKKSTSMEIRETIECYLKGETISDISKRLYRSTTFVKNILDKVGVPEKLPKTKQKGAAYLPEECVSESFEMGEKVWSASYHAPAIIEEEYTKEYQNKNAGLKYTNYEDKYGCSLYRVWIIEGEAEWNDRFGYMTGGFSAHQLAYDLGSLKHLEQYGVRL